LKGIIDSDNLSLAISHEKLQQKRIIAIIRKIIIKKVFKFFNTISEKKEDFDIYEQFLKNIKI
jgi:HSP90 family molecular chaperone